MLGSIESSDRINPSKRKFFFFFIGLVLFIAAGAREGWADYDNYVKGFGYVLNGFYGTMEPSFVLITYVVNFFIGNVLGLFFVYAFIGVSVKFLAIKQLTQLWFFSILIYLSNFYILHDLIQIRAGIASALLLLSIKPIYERNFKKFLFLFILAFLFHYSSLVILPLWFLFKKPPKILLYSIIPIGYVLYLLNINLIMSLIPIPAIKHKLELYQEVLAQGRQNEINVFNLVFLMKICLYYVLLFKMDLINKKNKYFNYLIQIFALSLFSFPAFATMPVVAFRISELFGIVEVIIIPFLYYAFKPQSISKMIVISVGLSFFYISIFYSKYLFN